MIHFRSMVLVGHQTLLQLGHWARLKKKSAARAVVA